MKQTPKLTLLSGLLLAALAGGSASGATAIIGDQYNVTGSGSGFALGTGVNTGINPPATRLTGSAAANLRYIKAYGAKADSAHTISNNKLNIAKIATDSSTLSLSAGSGAYDFGSALGSLAATPANPAVYEVTIKIANTISSSQRCSFAISSTAGTAGNWDFGIQLYRATTSDAAYTLQKRINATIAGAAVNSPITTVGTWPNEVAFLIRVTDAGAETGTFHSRVQVSTDGGTSWVYDSSTDSSLPNGWGFPTASRFIYFDIAGGAGPVTFDDFAVNWISGPTSAPRTWSGNGTDNNWSSGANWAGVAPSTGDALIFAGTTRQVNNNDLVGLTVPWMAFNNGGFVLMGNTLTNIGAITNLSGVNTLGLELDWSSVATKVWSLASGSELALTNTTSIEANGDHNLYGGGNLRVKGPWSIGTLSTANPAFIINEGQLTVDGGTFSTRGGLRIGSMASATTVAQVLLTNGATLSLTAAGANLRVGDSASALTNRLLLNNSTLSLSGGTLTLPTAAGSTGEVSQVGGLVSGGVVSFSDAGAGRGTYSLKNGTLEALQIKKVTAAGSATIQFDNATLRPSPGANSSFFSGLNTAEIQAGGLVLDISADVTVAQNLSGAGALTKSGLATLTLSGNNTYAGSTLVQAGKLVLPTGKTYTGSLQVADYAELGVSVTAAGTTLTNGPLSLGNGCTLSFDLGSFSTPTAPLLAVSSLTASGSVTVNVQNGLGLTPGQIVLVSYAGSIGSGGFGAFSLGTLPSGVSATLVNNAANHSIDLNITAVPGYRWTGAQSGDWDYATANWFSAQTGSASTYAEGYPTTLDDRAATGNINLAIYPSPVLLVVSNNTLPYVLSGGTLTVPTMRKYGTNSLTRIGGEADIIGSLELNEGSYILSNFYDATFTTVLTDASTGLGTLVKRGDSTLTVASTNSTFDGDVLIEQGTVKLKADRALGSTKATLIITNGATLDLNDFTPGAQPVLVSGDGVNGQGAIIDTTTGGAVGTNLRDVTLAGDTTLGCPNGGRWDLRARQSTGPGPGLRGNGYKLTKVGSGSVSIACQRTTTGYWQMNLGDVLIKEGTLTFAEALTPGNPAAALTILPGATLNLYDLGWTNPLLRTITMTDAKISAGGGATDTNLINGDIHLSGTASFFVDSANLILNGTLSGAASVGLAVNSPGLLLLNGTNTYTGDTTVTNGTLGGSGVLAGNLVMLAGTNAPGMGVGTLTVNGNVTLNSSTLVMELDRSQAANSDRLVVGGTLNVAGATLNVVLGPGAPAPHGGDLYRLFNKAPAGSFAAVNLPDLSPYPGGLSWDTSKLYVDGTLAVLGAAAPPSIGTVALNGANLVFSGTGGSQGSPYYVLSSTNVAAPMSTWVPVATNVFGPGGSFSVTNAVGTGPALYFRIQLP